MPRNRRWLPIIVLGVLLPLGLGLGSWVTRSMHGTSSATMSAGASMTLNGKKYFSALSDPTVQLREDEAGFNTITTLTVFFPLQRPGNRGAYGFSIQLDPERVAELASSGEPIFFGGWADEPESREARAIRLEYAPFSMADIRAEIDLTFYSGSDGGGEILFDTFEPELGGTISGTLVSAELHGSRWSINGGEPLDGEPLVLEVENLSFEGTVEEPSY